MEVLAGLFFILVILVVWLYTSIGAVDHHAQQPKHRNRTYTSTKSNQEKRWEENAK